MQNSFIRTESLIGKSALKKLMQSHVAVFGAGGVGGYTIEALARAGVGEISVIDNDIVSYSNLNRQIIALNSTIGKYKVDVIKNRILDINPNCKVHTYKTFFLEEKSSNINFKNFDYIADAIDTIKGKIELVACAKKYNIPIISSMGAGNKLDLLQFEIDDIYHTSVCPLARVVRTELKKRGIKDLVVVYSKEKPIKNKNLQNNNSDDIKKGSISFVPSCAGLIVASYIIKDIIKEV